VVNLANALGTTKPPYFGADDDPKLLKMSVAAEQPLVTEVPARKIKIFLYLNLN